MEAARKVINVYRTSYHALLLFLSRYFTIVPYSSLEFKYCNNKDLLMSMVEKFTSPGQFINYFLWKFRSHQNCINELQKMQFMIIIYLKKGKRTSMLILWSYRKLQACRFLYSYNIVCELDLKSKRTGMLKHAFHAVWRQLKRTHM